jgi:hypothetical protein
LDDFIIVDSLYSENISVSKLEEEIETLDNIRQDMLILENNIKTTDINLNNLCQGYTNNDEKRYPKDYSIAKYMNDKSKVEKINALGRTITPEQLRMYHLGYHHSLTQDVINKIKEVLESGEKSVLMNKIMYVEQIIGILYSSYLAESKIKLKLHDPDYVLQAYKVKHYNNQVRKELKELEKKYGTMKNIIDKLTFAYSKILEL